MSAKVFFVLSQTTRLTDGQTYGRTFCSRLYRALHLHYTSHGKKQTSRYTAQAETFLWCHLKSTNNIKYTLTKQ